MNIQIQQTKFFFRNLEEYQGGRDLEGVGKASPERKALTVHFESWVALYKVKKKLAAWNVLSLLLGFVKCYRGTAT